MAKINPKVRRFLHSVNLGIVMPLSLEEKLARLEHDPAWMTIDLPIGGRSDAVEEVMVEKIGDKRYRLASSPGMVQGLAAADVIALDNQAATGFRLLQRGQNICVHLFCNAAERDSIQAALNRELGRIGGALDATMGQTGLCYTIPLAVGFKPIEGALQKVVGDKWEYSNMHDPETGEPLNWWLKK